MPEAEIGGIPADMDSMLDSDSQSADGANARRFWIWGTVFVGLIALLGLLAWGLWRPSLGGPSGVSTNDGPARIAILDRPAADFDLPLILPYNGDAAFRLSDYRGQTVVLNFWASWCAPCRDEAPALEQAWQKYRNEDVVFLGVNTWDSQEDARIFMQSFGLTFPNVLDEPGTTAVEYGMMGIPETYFISPDGMISRKVIGGVTVDSISQAIEEARAAN